MSFAQGSALARKMVNGKYGFGYPSLTKKDGMGYPLVETLAIPAIYDNTSPVTFADEFENLVAVELNGKWGFIDATGATKLPFKWDEAAFFYEGLAPVKLNGKCGFIDKTGTIVLPLKYDLATSFKDGLAYVELGGKVGFINKKGEVVVPIKYDRSSDATFRKCYHCGGAIYNFQNGKCPVVLNGKCGTVDMKGNFTPCEDLPEMVLDSTFFSGTVNANKDLWGGNPGASFICNCKDNGDVVRLAINNAPYKGYSFSDSKLVFSFDRTWKPGQKVAIKIVHKKGCTFKLSGKQGFDAEGGKDQFAPEKVVNYETTTFSGTSNGQPWIDIMGHYISKVSVNDIDDAVVAKSIQRIGGDMQKIDLKKLKINKGDKITVKVSYYKGGDARLINGGALDK